MTACRHHPPTGRLPALRGLRLAALLAAALSACGAERPPAAVDTDLPPPRTYAVRGQVTSIADGGATLFLRHEPIDDFVDVTGRTSGMDSMVMPFPLGDGVGLEGVEVGDPVAVTLEIDWGAEPPARITAIEELPAGTELVFGPTDPG